MERTTSFSLGVKSELARISPDRDCCRLAVLSAIARLDGVVTIDSDEGIGIYIVSEYSSVARLIFSLFKEVFGIEAELTVKRQNRLKKRMLYQIGISKNREMPTLLRTLGIFTTKNSVFPGIKKDIIKNKCCRRSYLRGAFLGGGYVSKPDSSYHLELTTANEELGRDLTKLINGFDGFHAKLGRRRSSYMVYLKDSRQIADFLALIGAHSGLLEFENTRVLKGMKNQVNRAVNCETANLDKTVKAAIKQVSDIRLIEQHFGLDILSPSLAQIARLRLENPEDNLKELGDMMTPPLGKSGVNHRLRKISEFADGISESKDESGKPPTLP